MYHRTTLALLAIPALVWAESPSIPRTVTTKVWTTRSLDAPREIPKPPLYPEREVLGVGKGDTLGICFTGGGSMAATCAVAQLAALKKMGVLEHVDYVSTVSGGTWGVLPYIFLSPAEADAGGILKGQKLSQAQLDEIYLGKEMQPEELTAEVLLADPVPGSIQHIVTNTRMTVWPSVFGDENYAHRVGNSFLKPLGLGDRNRFVAPSAEYFERHIKPKNPGLEASQFYFPAPKRPFLIANGSTTRALPASIGVKLIRTLGLEPRGVLKYAYWPMEMTPLYSGHNVWARHWRWMPTSQELGGGYVESFAYDARFGHWTQQGSEAEVRLTPDFLELRRGRPFSLSDIAAVSGAAPAAMWHELFAQIGYSPEIKTFSPRRTDQEHLPSKERVVLDGGATDNLGLAPLLARGCKRIIVFANSCGVFEPMPENPEECTADGRCKPGSGNAEAAAVSKYGMGTPVTAIFGQLGNVNWRNHTLAQAETNHLLDNEWSPNAKAGQRVNRCKELSDAFTRLAGEGKPLVYTATYRTTDGGLGDGHEHHSICPTQKYGVLGGQTVTICWVYLTATRPPPKQPRAALKLAGRVTPYVAPPGEPGACAWDNDPWLSRVAAQELFNTEAARSKHELNYFPSLKVFFSHGMCTQRLSNVQANSLYHYARYNTASSEKLIKAMVR